MLVLLVVCAGAGLLNRINPLWSDLVFLVLAALGLLAVGAQPHSDTPPPG